MTSDGLMLQIVLTSSVLPSQKPFEAAEFQAALDRTISCLTLAGQHSTPRPHLGREQ